MSKKKDFEKLFKDFLHRINKSAQELIRWLFIHRCELWLQAYVDASLVVDWNDEYLNDWTSTICA